MVHMKDIAQVCQIGSNYNSLHSQRYHVECPFHVEKQTILLDIVI